MHASLPNVFIVLMMLIVHRYLSIYGTLLYPIVSYLISLILCFLLLSLLYSTVFYLLSSILLYLLSLRACHSMYSLYSFYFIVPRLTWYATLTDSIARTMYECYYWCTCLHAWGGGGEAKLCPLHFLPLSHLYLLYAFCNFTIVPAIAV